MMTMTNLDLVLDVVVAVMADFDKVGTGPSVASQGQPSWGGWVFYQVEDTWGPLVLEKGQKALVGNDKIDAEMQIDYCSTAA